MTLISSLFKKRATKPVGYAWMGLDFGTATTECVIRIEVPGQADKVAVLAFGGTSRANAKIILPSAMELLDGRVLPAYSLVGKGQIVETIKTKLIAEIDRSIDPARLRRQESPFMWAMLHLASVLAVARAAIERWVGSSQVHFYLNIAAPIGADPENVRDARIREVFRELAYRALELSSAWPAQPPTEVEAASLFRQGMAVALPSADASPVVAVPEALAAVTSFLHAAHRKAGNYATVDVGGGTTDISYFWFQTGQYDSEHEKKAWYYSVRTTPVGTNDLIAGLSMQLEPIPGITAHERLRGVRAPQEHIHEPTLKGFLFGLNSSYREAFRNAFKLRPIHREWCKDNNATWTLLLLGGGCGFPFVQEHLEGTPPLNMNISKHGAVETLSAPRLLSILLPDGTVLSPSTTGASAKSTLAENGHLVTLAYGLAFRAPDIPKYGVETPIAPPPPPRAWEPPPHTVHN